MSIKSFHIVFVACSIALSAFIGVWGIREYSATRNAGELAIGVGAIVGGLVLVVYSNWFIKKIRTVKELR